MTAGQFSCAAYVRLSREDGDKNESDSVGNQKKMIEHYIAHHDNFVLYDHYIDDADIIGLNQKTFVLRGFTD